MKVYNKNKEHVKTVPKKFGVFSDEFINAVCYTSSKRLSEHERDILEDKLVYFYFSKYLSESRGFLTNEYITNNIKIGFVPRLKKVERKDGTYDWELFFSENNSVRVSRSDFPECIYSTGYRY